MALAHADAHVGGLIPDEAQSVAWKSVKFKLSFVRENCRTQSRARGPLTAVLGAADPSASVLYGSESSLQRGVPALRVFQLMPHALQLFGVDQVKACRQARERGEISWSVIM